MPVAKRKLARRLPVGAEVQPGGGVHFRVWAPRRKRVEVVIGSKTLALARESGGYFSGLAAEAGAGTRYRYRLDGGDAFPDPASRYQPEGPHGSSEVIDPTAYRWRDGRWKGLAREALVIYEMHIGTFTREGTWRAAARELPALAALGVSMVEMMPVADFPGRFGWGYDGVDLFAPTRLYGTPDDLRAFVDRAHALGIAVILDVVYNHVGPDGNFLREFSPHFFTRRHANEWGDAIDFDGPRSSGVREFFVSNARYWIDEFHMDGLRLDATQQIFDASRTHVLEEVGDAVRGAARGRNTFVVAENETQQARLVRSTDRGGYGLDALWNDDFHHAARVALTRRNEAYYGDYLGTPQEFVSAARHGFLFQGQCNTRQAKRRGTPALDLGPASLVTFLENHDQVANSSQGLRLHQLAAPGAYRAMTAVLLLGPQIPMLFQGQEFASSKPFVYFADHDPELARLVRKGRAEFLAQFPSIDANRVPDPAARETFERCVLDLDERKRNASACALHRDLLRLRREDPAFRSSPVDGAVLSGEAFVLRYFRGAGDRLLLVNLGRDLVFNPSPEPLLAPPEGARWKVLWSSEDPRYGGSGTGAIESGDGWRLPGQSTVVMSANFSRHKRK